MLQSVAGGTTTNYHWDGWDLVQEDKTGTINETTKYLVPEGEVLAFKRDGETYHLHGDGLSSTQLVTDSQGSQVARFVYGAWGQELQATDNIPNGLDFRFVGGLGVRKDPTTGLIYMRHRWYDPALQRFISRDPIKFGGGTNLYEYVNGNPTNLVDPEGLQPLTITPPTVSPPQPYNPGGGASIRPGGSSSGPSAATYRSPRASSWIYGLLLLLAAPAGECDWSEGDLHGKPVGKRKGSKCTCHAKCNIVIKATLGIVGKAHGTGYGSNCGIARKNAIKSANDTVPTTLHRIRHCKVKCEPR